MKKLISVSLGSTLLVFAALVYWAHFTISGLRWMNTYVIHNHDHFLPCEALPSREQVARLLEENRNLVKAIEREGPPTIISVFAGTPHASCPEKADITIFFGSLKQRESIEEKFLNDKHLLGVPVTLRNV